MVTVGGEDDQKLGSAGRSKRMESFMVMLVMMPSSRRESPQTLTAWSSRFCMAVDMRCCSGVVRPRKRGVGPFKICELRG